jgi:hypothetical protein
VVTTNTARLLSFSRNIQNETFAFHSIFTINKKESRNFMKSKIKTNIKFGNGFMCCLKRKIVKRESHSVGALERWSGQFLAQISIIKIKI